MIVIVDTPVWSLVLRRRPGDLNPSEQVLTKALTELIREGRVEMLGPIRQELLSGIREEGQFEKIQGILDGNTDSNSFSFNKDIFRLIKAGKISKAEGLRFSPNPQALEMNLKGIFIKT